MKRLLKKLSCTFGVAMMLTVVSSAFPFVAEAKEQTVDIDGLVYEFGKKSEYEIDSSEPSDNADKEFRIGTLSINGDIQRNYEKNGITAYEIADDGTFSLDFKYIDTLKKAEEDSWHLIEDGDDVVNGIELSDDIDYGALILQTSFDGEKWVTVKTHRNLTKDKSFSKDQINDIQLANGCYYRVISAFEVEKRTKENKIFDDYDTKKIAQVYEFYASYKDIDTTPTGEKYYFYAGAKNASYTVGTKKNNYAGSQTITKDDPHYGWDLGYFCLSGYTDKGDSDDVYLKKVGNKVKLTFHLDQDINKLNGNSDLKIESDKDGSDEAFKVKSHNMKHGELIIRHTDNENLNKEAKYSDFLAALASPGADTSVQLFEEGDYEVHLNYAITDDDKMFGGTTYYQTSFSFKVRNANCMVYIFDEKTGTELSNGDVTENGFRIDTANSKYTKIAMTRKILNNTQTGLTDDTRFNGAVSNGEEFKDEGIYTIYAYNPDLNKVKDFEATIYVGNNNILAAYTKHLNSSNPYEISELNTLVDKGYTITDDGDIIEPVVETTTVTTQTPETTATKTETTTTTVTSAEPSSAEVSADTSSDTKTEGGNNTALPIVGGGVGIAAVGGIIAAVLRKKR